MDGNREPGPNGRDAHGRMALVDLPVGASARVLDIDAEFAGRLIAHGLRVGSIVSVEGDGPFHGPRIVRVGTARIAVARSVTRGVTLQLTAPHGSSTRTEPGP